MTDDIKPASPLPWQIYYGDDESNQQQTIIDDDDTVLWSSYPGGCENNAVLEDAEYAVHAANEYPKLRAENAKLLAVVEAAKEWAQARKDNIDGSNAMVDHEAACEQVLMEALDELE
jgi:hypothetical protein